MKLRQYMNKHNFERKNVNTPITKEDLLTVKALKITDGKKRDNRFFWIRIHDKYGRIDITKC